MVINKNVWSWSTLRNKKCGISRWSFACRQTTCRRLAEKPTKITKWKAFVNRRVINTLCRGKHTQVAKSLFKGKQHPGTYLRRALEQCSSKFWFLDVAGLKCISARTRNKIFKNHTRVWPRIRDQATMFILCYRFGCQCPANRPAKTVSIKRIAGQRGTVAGQIVPRPSQ